MASKPKSIGPYPVQRELGRGSLGTVYLVLDGSQPRALKWLHDAGPEAARRLQQEFDIGRMALHSNLVRAHLQGVHRKRPYLLLDFVDGGPLRQQVQGLDLSEPRNLASCLELFRQLALGLEALHVSGWVHGDLKPDNILVDRLGTVRLTDFGLAQAWGSSVSAGHGTITGSPAYLAPEQVLGVAGLEGRADLYALGVVLYEVLAGRKPFQALDWREEAYRRVTESPVSPRSLSPWINAALEALVMKLLQRQPEARFATAQQVAQALGEAALWQTEALRPFLQAAPKLLDPEEIARPALQAQEPAVVVELTDEALRSLDDLAASPEVWKQRCRLLAHRSQACYRLGRLEESLRLAQEACQAAAAAQEPTWRIALENNLGVLHGELGQTPRSLAHYRTALSLARELGQVELEAKLCANLAWLQLRHGRQDRARELLAEALQWGRELRDPSLVTSALLNLAELELEAGEIEAAEPRLGETALLAASAGLEVEAARCRVLQGCADRDAGRLGQAAQAWQEALVETRRLGEEAWTQRALLELAELELELGRLGAGEDWLRQLAKLDSAGSQEPQQPVLRLRARRLEAVASLLRGQWEQAATALQRLQGRTGQEDPLESLRIQLALGRALCGLGRDLEAQQLLQRAERRCLELGAGSLLGAIRTARSALAP